MMEFYVDDFENYEHLGHFYMEGDVEGPEEDQAAEGADRRDGQDSESESDIDVLDPDPVAGEGDDDDIVVQEEVAAALDMSQEGCCVEAENQQNLRWSQGLSDVRIREFSQSSGPQHSLPLDATPLDYFSLLWPESLFETITEETNRYAEQRMAAAKKKDPYWVPTAVNEIKAFFALAIMMGIKNLPRLYCYWAGNVALRCDWISGTMSHSRYVKINQYLHVRDNMSMPRIDRRDYDPIFKVRNVVETVRENFGRYYYPHCEVAVDEGMIPFKGRLFFKQHMPAKPTKWGVKVWELCESETGYCLNFDIYTGRNRKAGPTHGLGHQVVMSLTQPYWHRNHHVYFDRFFSSPRLLEDMLKCSLYGCSTINMNRVGLPDEAKQLKLRNKGDVEFFQKGNLVLTVWRDKRVVVMLTSNSEGKMLTLPDGRLKPDAIMKYNKYMGGVDRSDQYRSYYHVGRTSKKWWRYIIWFLMNLSIVNAWLLYRESKHDPPPPKGYDHFQFRIELAEQLRAGFSGRCQTKGRKPKHDRSECYAEAIGAHKLVRIPNRKRVCRECSQNGRKTRSGRQIQTSFRCGICDLPLCRARCFREYHKSIAADAAIVVDVGGEDKEDEEEEEREEGGEGEVEVEEADVEIVSVNGPNVASAGSLGDQEVNKSPAPREPSFNTEASSTSEAAEVAGDRREAGVGTQEPSLVDSQSQASAQPAKPVCSSSTEGVSGVAVCGTSTEDDDLVIIVGSSTAPPVTPNFQEKRAIVKIKTRKRQRKAKSKSGPMSKKDVSTSTSVDASEGILTQGTVQATSAPAGPDGRDGSAEAAARANEIIVIDLTDEEDESASLQQQLLPPPPPAPPLVAASKRKKKKRPKKRRSKNRNAGQHKKNATDSSTKKRKTAMKEKVAVSSQRKGAHRACKAAGIGVYQDKVNCSGRGTPRARKQAPEAVIIDLTGEDEVAPESSVDMADSTLPLARLGDTDGAEVMMEAADRRKENNTRVAVDGDVLPKAEPADQSLSKGVPSAVCHQPQEDITRGEDESEAVVSLLSDDAILLGGAGHVYPQQRRVTSTAADDDDALRADLDPTRQAEGTAATDFNIKAERGDVDTATAVHPENAAAEMERTKMVLREGSGDKSADEDVDTHRPEEAVAKDVAKNGAPQKSGEEITVPRLTVKLEKTDARTPASDLLHSPPTVLVPGVDITGTVAINPTEESVLMSIGGTLLSVAGSRRGISKDTTQEHAEQSQMARPTESNNPHRGADPKGATDESDIVDRCRLMTSKQCEASARADVGDGCVRDARLCEMQSRQGKHAPRNAAEETASAKDVGNIGDLTSSSCSTSSSSLLPSSSSFIDVISTTTTWTPSGIQKISDRMGIANLWRTTQTRTQNCVCFNLRALDDSVEVATDSNQEEHKIAGVSESDAMTDADQPKKPTASEKDKTHYIDEYIETLSPMKIDNEVILSPIETMHSTNATVSSGQWTKTTHLNQSHGEWKEHSNVTVDDIFSNLKGKGNKTGNASDTNDTAHTGTASVGNWSRGGDANVSSQVSDKEEIRRIDKQHIDNKVSSSQGSNVDLVKTVHTLKPLHDETKLDMTPIEIDDDDDETVSSSFTDTSVIPMNKGHAKDAANTTGSAARQGCATDAGESEKHKCPQCNIPGYQESATDGQYPNTRGAELSYNVRKEDLGVIYIDDDDDDDDDNSPVSFAEVSSSKRIDNATTGETGQDESRELFYSHNGDTDCRNRKGREINVDKLANTSKGINPQIEVIDRAESCDIRREKHRRLDDTIQIGETGKDSQVAQNRADDDALAPDMGNHDDAPPDSPSASYVNIAPSAELRRVSETADGMGAGDVQRFDNTITIEGVIDAGDANSKSPDEGDAGEHRLVDNNAQRVGTQEENHGLFDEASVIIFSSSSVINISTMPTTTSSIAPSVADDKGSEKVRKSPNADTTNICNAHNKTNTTRAGAYQKDQASSGIVEDTQRSIARYSAGRPQPKSAVLSPSSLSSSLIDISSTSAIDSTTMTRMTDDRGAGYFRKTGSAATEGTCHDAKNAQNTTARAAHSTGQDRASSGLADATTRPESDIDGVQVSTTREEHSHHRRDEETAVRPTEGNRDEDSSLLSATEISVDSANKSKHARGRAFQEDVGDKWKKTSAITESAISALNACDLGSPDTGAISTQWEGHEQEISHKLLSIQDDSRGLEQDSNSAPTSGCHTHVVGEPMDTNEGICCRKDTPATSMLNRSHKSRFQQQRGIKRPATENESMDPCETQSDATTVAEAAWPGEAAFTVPSDAKRACIRDEQPLPDQEVQDAGSLAGCGDDEAISPLKIIAPQADPDLCAFNSPPSRFVLSSKLDFPAEATLAQLIGQQRSSRPGTSVDERLCLTLSGVATRSLTDDLEMDADAKPSIGSQDSLLAASSFASCGTTSISPRAETSGGGIFPWGGRRGRLVAESVDSCVGSSQGSAFCLALVTGFTKDEVSPSQERDYPEPSVNSSPSEGTRGYNETLYACMAEDNAGDVEAPVSNDEGLGGNDEAPESNYETPRINYEVLRDNDEATRSNCETPRRNDDALGYNVEVPGSNNELLESNNEALGSNDEALGCNDEVLRDNDEATRSNYETPRRKNEAPGSNNAARGCNDEAVRSNDEVFEGNDETPGSGEEAPGGSDEALGSDEEAPGGSDGALGSNEEATNATSKARVANEGTDTKSLRTSTTTTTPADELACADEDTAETSRCEATSRDVRETANSAIAAARARGFLERNSEPCADAEGEVRSVEDSERQPSSTRPPLARGGTRKRALEEGMILSRFPNVAKDARSGRTCRVSTEEGAAPFGSPARKLRVLEAAVGAGVRLQARAAGQEGQ